MEVMIGETYGNVQVVRGLLSKKMNLHKSDSKLGMPVLGDWLEMEIKLPSYTFRWG